MKKLLIVIIFAAASTVSFADNFSSEFILQLANRGVYNVHFDNDFYNTSGNLEIYNVRPGRHYLEISESIVPRNGNRNAHGVLVIYKGYVDVPARAQVFGTVDYRNYFVVDRIVSFARANAGFTCQPTVRGHVCDYHCSNQYYTNARRNRSYPQQPRRR